ncbi:MAG: hypothetical protein C0518_11335 [Opitutus sp.]|nr:hypothetical protein [Opitutus sp.]
MLPTLLRRLRWCALALLALGLTLTPHAAERVTRGNLRLENIPDIPPALAERTQQYQNTRSALLCDFDPAGDGLLIATRFGNTAQIHRVEKPGGMRRQLTFFNEPVANASFSPDPRFRGFTFTRDTGGGEFFQLYWFDLATGKATLLSDGKSRNGGATWSSRGDRFVYTSTRRNGRDTDLYVVNMANPTKSELLLEVKGTWGATDWSPDDSQLLIGEFISANESRVFVLDLATKALTQLNPQPKHADPISYGGGRFTKDGKGLLFASDQDSEFQRLRYYDLATGKQEVLTPDIDWDIAGMTLSDDGRTLAFVANENGVAKLYLLDTATRKRTPVDLPMGGIARMRFAPDSQRLGLTINTPQTPGDTYVLSLADRKMERWTFSEVGGLDTSKFVTPELITYRTFDESAPGKPREIPAIIYQPKHLPAGAKAPVLVSIHGGPEGQSTVGFSSFVQFLVNEMGMAVVLPNVRGSEGYGKTYLKLDNVFQREDSVKDIGALLDWIEDQPTLDQNRVAVYGGSYGGYMVLAAMTHYNDRLAAGIDVVGISNFSTFLKNTQDYRRDLRRAEYGDERDSEVAAFFDRISPLNHMHKVNKPMLIAQGYNDPRVPVTEAEQVVEAIKKNGAQPWYFLAMDEGHGFAKKNNSDHFQNAMMLFLEQNVIKKPAAAK